MKQTPLKSYTPLRAKTGLKRSRVFINRNPDLVEADSKFSKIIIQRDGRCLNCASQCFLSCSHFFGRSNYATRFDPQNCITLCIVCHDLWESKKNGVYKEFMIVWLGFEEFCKLEERSKIRMRPVEAVASALKEMKNLPINEIQY